MSRMTYAILGAAALLGSLAGAASAKDMFYSLGYGRIEVIDGSTDSVVATIPIKGWTRESVLTADKKFMYVTTNRHLLNKVDLAQNKVVSTVDLSSEGWDRFVFGLTLSENGKTGYMHFMSRRAENGDAVIGKPQFAEFDLATGKILRGLDVPWGVMRLVPVQGGKTVYAVGKDIYTIDVSGGELRIAGTYPLYEKKMNILTFWDYLWENGGVATTNYYTPETMGILMIDTKTGEISEKPIAGVPVFAYSVILSPDKKKAYAMMDDLAVIDMEKLIYSAIVPNPEGTCYGVNVSSDGKKIYGGPAGNTIAVFDAETLKPIKVIQLASDGMDLRRVTF
jgi:DNA-binding beta-propeller fold protein YncE